MERKRVFIVDDEKDHCYILKSYFQSKNYDVSIGFNLKEFRELLEQKEPDILLLDNNLPDGKGWALTGSLVEQYPRLKIYLISAYHQKGDPVPAHENITVWQKPISLSLLNASFA